ncbi:hypothetical protein F383_25796 [Gossypium arboreum]|uniref:Uncharacterized protein n=1 Tax=Gossypium arboreum TaxID=29729 RepID=A0A0B0P4N1_GOSAR|nr:hypothetical protein F383_25796 [Gossypium arboreum]
MAKIPLYTARNKKNQTS